MGRQRSHRFLLAFSVVSALSMVLTACGLPGNTSAGSTSDATITAGLIAPLTGQGAASGQDMVNGWNFYWQQHGTKLCSGKTTITTITQDTAGQPDVGVAKARALVEQQGAQLIAGPLFANVGYAVAQYTESKGIPLFPSVSSADDLTQRKANPLVLRIAGWSSSQPSHPLGDWVHQNYPQVKKVVTLGADYAFGYENVGGFVDTFTTDGGTIAKQLWAPLNTTDFSPYLSQIQGINPDGVEITDVGADSVRVVKAYSDFGLKGKYPLFGSENLTDQSLLRSMNPQQAEGIITAAHYADGRDAPATQDFVTAYDKQYHQIPSYYAAAEYTAAQWLAQSFEAVNCKISGANQKHWLDVVKQTKLADSPFGPMSLDSYGNPIMNIYIRKVEIRPDGRAWNVPIATIPNVSQFGTVDPATYLKQPVYSKTFQGNNYHP